MSTGNPAIVTPILFYDFNMPPRADGTYLCLPNPLFALTVGQSVLFGCAEDETITDGVVAALDEKGFVFVTAAPAPKPEGEPDA